MTLSFWQDLEDGQTEVETELTYSEAEPPPYRFDETVKRLCLIKWSKIPAFDDLPTWRNTQDKVIRHLCYEVRMVADGTSLDFAIYHQSKRVASQNVAIDFEGSGRPRMPGSAVTDKVHHLHRTNAGPLTPDH